MSKHEPLQPTLPDVFHKDCVDCRNLIKHTHCECDERSLNSEVDHDQVRMLDEGCPNVD